MPRHRSRFVLARFVIARFVLALLFLLPLAALAQPAPTLPRATPELRGFRSARLRAAASDAARQVPSLRALLVWRRDALVHEGYVHGAARDSAFPVMSVTKSVLSAIAGAAEARGLLGDLDRPVLTILPEYGGSRISRREREPDDELREADSLRHAITLRHLLTMRDGIGWNDSSDVAGAQAWSSDPARFYLDLPFEYAPGDTFNYSSAEAHLFAVALARLVGTDLRAFADSALFAPAGIRLRRWDVDPMGRYLGGSLMYFTAEDLVRFGDLYLKQGRVGSRQVLPAAWVEESTKRQVAIASRWTIPGVEGYGYYWWRRRGGGHRMYCAVGYGGQLVCVVPDLEMVCITICAVDDSNRGRAEIPLLLRRIDRIVREALPIPADRVSR